MFETLHKSSWSLIQMSRISVSVVSFSCVILETKVLCPAEVENYNKCLVVLYFHHNIPYKYSSGTVGAKMFLDLLRHLFWPWTLHRTVFIAIPVSILCFASNVLVVRRIKWLYCKGSGSFWQLRYTLTLLFCSSPSVDLEIESLFYYTALVELPILTCNPYYLLP